MLRSIFKWNSIKNNEDTKKQSSYLKVFLLKILEDIVFWKKWWFSLLFYSCFNIIFGLCVYRQINLLQFILVCAFMFLLIDGFETWLKSKHRTSCLKRLGEHDISRIESTGKFIYNWFEKSFKDFIYLRDVNHTKAFLLLQIIFTIIFFIGKYFNGYMLTYIFCTLLIFHHKFLPHIMKIVNKIQQNAESDLELEGLMPEASEANLDLLTFEPEQKAIADEKHSLDYWKPDDLPLEEISDDSSDTSSSLVTNLSIEKMQSLSRDVEVTDSSEDEYIPQQDQQTELVQTSMQVYPSGTWTNAAYNMFSNIGTTVASMVYNPVEDKRRKRVSSVDSSDGFEMIDKNDVL